MFELLSRIILKKYLFLTVLKESQLIHRIIFYKLFRESNVEIISGERS
jgi:hypothetical protein